MNDLDNDLYCDHVWVVWAYEGYSILGDSKRYRGTYASEGAARAALKSGEFFTKEKVQ